MRGFSAFLNWTTSARYDRRDQQQGTTVTSWRKLLVCSSASPADLQRVAGRQAGAELVGAGPMALRTWDESSPAAGKAETVMVRNWFAPPDLLGLGEYAMREISPSGTFWAPCWAVT